MKRNGLLLLVILALIFTAGTPFRNAGAEQQKTLLTIYEGPKTMESSRIAAERQWI